MLRIENIGGGTNKMIEKGEFINKLNDEINISFREYEDNEFKGLFEEYQNRLADSDYDTCECRCSLYAFGRLCDLRIQKLIKICDLEDSDIAVSSTIEDEKCSHNFSRLALLLKTAIIKIIIKMELLCANDEIENEGCNLNSKEINIYDEYYDDLGCSKKDMELLENLMGEFVEFDPYLRITQ